MQMNNLTEIALSDIMTLLETDKNPWPRGYTRVQKIQFLEKMMHYYEEKQEFSECAKVKKMIDGVINEKVIQTKKTKK